MSSQTPLPGSVLPSSTTTTSPTNDSTTLPPQIADADTNIITNIITEEPAPLYINPHCSSTQTTIAGNSECTLARCFHHSLPGFTPSQSTPLPTLASRLRIRSLHAKLETARLGLSSFKVLGASWGTFRAVCSRLNLDPSTPIADVASRAQSEGIMLFAASQGNHGLAVAKMGSVLGLRATIYLPSDASSSVADELRQLGATVPQSMGDYDDAVAEAFMAARSGAPCVAADAEKDVGKGVVVQDTAWEGYEAVPSWIVAGYSTILSEIDEQLATLGLRPDLVVTPVGVGSLAEAVVRHYKSTASARPHTRVLAVEPLSAACLQASLRANQRTTVQTTRTILAGMNCGTLSLTSWPVLRDGVDACIAISDGAAHERVERLYANGVAVGPCGAAAVAGLLAAVEQASDRLGLTSDSVVVVICTEGPRPYVYQGVQYPRAAHAQDGQPAQRIVLT